MSQAKRIYDGSKSIATKNRNTAAKPSGTRAFLGFRVHFRFRVYLGFFFGFRVYLGFI